MVYVGAALTRHMKIYEFEDVKLAQKAFLEAYGGLIRTGQTAKIGRAEEQIEGKKYPDHESVSVMKLAGIFRQDGKFALKEYEYTMHRWYTEDPDGFEQEKRPGKFANPVIMTFAPEGPFREKNISALISAAISAEKREFNKNRQRLEDINPGALF